MGENEEYSLREIFYNLAFIYRAYNRDDLFLPIKKYCYVKRVDRSDWWDTVKVDAQFNKVHQLMQLPDKFIIDVKEKEELVIQYKHFRFKGDNTAERLLKNHHNLRWYVQLSYGSSRMWYI